MYHLLFDLDRTLWDFDGNAEVTFRSMFDAYGLEQVCGTDWHSFHETYRVINDALWEAYRNGTIEKEVLRIQRFVLPLQHYGVASPGRLAEKLSDYYVYEGPKQTGLMPGARHLLDYLAGRGYAMSVITNGFSEAQLPKMRTAGIDRYFENVFLSEDLGVQKPDLRFFELALARLGLEPEECLVVGDDLKVDIEGARRAGIPQLFYNYKLLEDLPFRPTYMVHNLCEIESIL